MSNKKTIVILSAKRCGSTALYKTLVNHNSVKNCLVRGKSRNWEPAFWYHGWQSLMRRDPSHMREHFFKNYSYIDIPDVNSRYDLFDIWDKVLAHRGPIVLDKSPQYLARKPALELLLEYKAFEKDGRDVRIIGLIRDPRDAIASQYVKWHVAQEKKSGMVDSPERRAEKWLEKYRNLEYVRKIVPDMLMIRYEDFVYDTFHTVKKICDYCGIKYQFGMASHVTPTHVGRYKTSHNKKVKEWRNNLTLEFKKHLSKYNYA